MCTYLATERLIFFHSNTPSERSLLSTLKLYCFSPHKKSERRNQPSQMPSHRFQTRNLIPSHQRFQPARHCKHLIRSSEPLSQIGPKSITKHPTPSHTPAPMYSPWPPHPGTPKTTQRSLQTKQPTVPNRKRGRQLGPKKHFVFSYNGIRNERPFFYVHNCDRLRGVGRFWSAFKHEKLGFDSVD